MNSSFFAAGRFTEPAAVVDIAVPFYSIVRFVGYTRHSLKIQGQENAHFLASRTQPVVGILN
jgi:hypothetical protein